MEKIVSDWYKRVCEESPLDNVIIVSINPLISIKDAIQNAQLRKAYRLEIFLRIRYCYNLEQDRQSSDSLKWMLRAERRAIEINDLELLGHVYFHLGKSHLANSNTQKAIDSLNSSSKFFEEIGKKWESIKALTLVPGLIFALGKVEEAIKLGSIIIESANSLQCPNLIGIANNNLGISLLLTKNYSDCLPYFEKALRYAIEAENLVLQAAVTSNIGINLSNHGMYQSAIKSFSEALEYYRKQNQRDQESFLLNNIALSYFLHKDNSEEALYYLEKTKEASVDIHNSYFKCHLHLNYAFIFHKLGFTNRFKECLYESINSYDESDAPVPFLEAMLGWVYLLIRLNDYHQAHYYLQKADVNITERCRILGELVKGCYAFLCGKNVVSEDKLLARFNSTDVYEIMSECLVEIAPDGYDLNFKMLSFYALDLAKMNSSNNKLAEWTTLINRVKVSSKEKDTQYLIDRYSFNMINKF